jgi:hypothetical protein
MLQEKSVTDLCQTTRTPTYHICKERRCVRVIHGVILIYDGLSKQLLRLRSVLPVLDEEHVGCWTSKLERGQPGLVSYDLKQKMA